MSDSGLAVRIDRWLWAARLFKTRNLAGVAVRGGRVQIDGHRAKPSRGVRIGDQIRVTKDQSRIELVVTGLSDKRGPARLAAELYYETPASIERRNSEREGRRIERAATPVVKPDKKGRRLLRRLMGRD